MEVVNVCGRANASDNEGVRLLLALLGMDTLPSRELRFNITPPNHLTLCNTSMLTSMCWGISMNLKGYKEQPITKRIPNPRDDRVWIFVNVTLPDSATPTAVIHQQSLP